MTPTAPARITVNVCPNGHAHTLAVHDARLDGGEVGPARCWTCNAEGLVRVEYVPINMAATHRRVTA